MTFSIILYDALNALRTRVETERTSMLVRGLVNEALTPDVMRIWVWDGMWGNANRRKIFAPYKLNRKPTPNGEAIFKSMAFLRDILSLTPAWQCRHKDFEGDDMIAALVKMFPDTPIKIVSTDRDLLPLTDGVRVTSTATPFTKVSVPIPMIRLFKLTVGDPSDGIPGLPGFGIKGWEKCDKFALAEALDMAMKGKVPSDALYDRAYLGKRARNFIAGPDSPAQLLAQKTVIAPLPVSPEQMESALWQGKDDPLAREALLKEFLL
jgi:hypothetical protein